MVKATEEIKFYRNRVLGLPIKDFRKLQKGEAVKVPPALIEKYPKLFNEVKKDGD